MPLTPLRVLDPDRLIADAERDTQLSDWGEPKFAEALTVLCRSAGDEAGLGAEQAAGFASRLHGLLTTRLLLYADRRAYPQIAAQRIVAPLVVTGLPRGGTTILHALLAQDPAVRSPAKWEVDRPSPPPRAETRATDPRIALADADVAALPDAFKAMHAIGATLPEECNSIQTLAFRSPNFAATATLPGYMRWLLEAAEMTPAYALHRHVLQHLQAFSHGDRWVLKAPPHLWWPDALFDTYPDARVVVMHRDPAQVMASNASLIAYLRGASTPAERHALGREQVAQWRLGLDRMRAFRAGRYADRFIDIHYADLLRAPMAVVRTIYDRFGLTLSEDAERAMTAFLAANAQGKHGRHDYDPAEFGFSREELHREFADYIQAYAIPTA